MTTEPTEEIDPMAALLGDTASMGGDLDQGADLDALGAELEQLADADAQSEDTPILPPGFDLFAPRPQAVQAVRAAGRDPRVVAVRVFPVQSGTRRGMIKKYRPEGLTYDGLKRALPPGTYDVHGVNADNHYIGGRRITLDDSEALPAPGTNHGNGGTNGASLADKLLYTLALRAIEPPKQNGPSEIEAATAAMLKGVAAMTQLQMADLKRQQIANETTDRKTERGESRSLEMFKLFLPYVAKQPKGNGSSSSGTGRFEDFVGAMQLGVQMARAMHPDAPPEPEDSLKSWILPLADSLGPGLVSVLAMMLPPEQRQMASELLESHFKAREAEAQAAIRESDDPPTVDAEGVTVGGDGE